MAVRPPPPPARDPDSGALPAAFWQASALGMARIREDLVTRANPALERLMGRPLAGRPATHLVAPAQAAAFEAFIDAAGAEWQGGTFTLAPGGHGSGADFACWAVRRGGIIELIVEAGWHPSDTVESSLLALVDETIELQRALERRTHELERAIAVTAEAQERAARLEKFLPICAWCRKVRASDDGTEAWIRIEDFLDGLGTSVSHGMCPACEAKMNPI